MSFRRRPEAIPDTVMVKSSCYSRFLSLTCILHKLCRFVKNTLQPQGLAAEVSTRRYRALSLDCARDHEHVEWLKVNPEQETRKWLTSKPAGRIFRKPGRVYEICGLTLGFK